MPRRNLLPRKGSTSAIFLLLLGLEAAFVASSESRPPACKEECNKNFTEDNMIEHPGVKSVCHRGCELFTVAFIATPRGGVPLVGPKPGVIPPAIMATLDEYGIPLGPANFPVKKDQTASPSTKKTGKSKPAPALEKHEKEREELEKSINKRINDESERMNVKRLISGGDEQKIVQKQAPIVKTPEKTESKKEIKNVKQNPVQFIDHFDLDDCPELTEEEIAALQKQIKIVDSKNLIDAKEEEVSKKKVVTSERLPVKDTSSKNNFHQLVYTRSKDKSLAKPGGKTPSKIHFERTFTGEKARELLNEARNVHAIKEPHVKVNSFASSVPHGPEKVKPQKTKDQSKTLNHPSKTTVQPVPLPVQDHPVQANRQITTDSSSSDDRKTTTPKSANPAIPLSIGKMKDIHGASKLTNKLGGNKMVHPLLHITLLKPKPMVQLMIPHQVSIIEIVKKKNNIDFEKLHQEHMEGASLCPEINERLDQAKQSCRHACVTAYSIPQEQDACVVGCHIRASSSMKQIEAQKTKPDNKLMPLFGPQNSILLGKDGLLSSFTKMFSNFAHNIGEVTEQDSPLNLMGPDGPISSHISSVEKSGSISTDKNGHQIINSRTVVHMNTPDKHHHRTEVNIVQGNIDPLGHLLPDRKVDELFQHTFDQLGNKQKEVELLNKEIEIMGFHLNEKPKEQTQPQIPKFIKDILSGRRVDPLSLAADESSEHKSGAKETSTNLNLPASFQAEPKDSGDNSQDRPTKSEFASSFSGFVHSKGFIQSDNTDVKPSSLITVKQLQQLDLLECISRKSGLPRWLIGMTIFASALLVVWLCFSLYSPGDEFKLFKKKVPPTVVLCDGDDHNGCSEEKHLLPQDDCVKIHFQNV